MKKFFSILIINVVIFVISIFIIEIVIWTLENEHLRRNHDSYRAKGLLPFHKGIKFFKLVPEYFPNPDDNWGRAPEGLEFNSKPIVFFGCSYTFGMDLPKEATLPYKLAYLAKRPTYNRAYQGWGVQHMLYQTKLPKLYEQIPEPEYVIYTHMNDHPRRLYILTFMAGHMLNEDFNLRYKEKNGELIEIQNKNNFLNFVKRLYITNEIYHFYVKHFVLSKNNLKNVYDFELKHFIESKKEMQKHWKNTKYVVLFYDKMYDDEYLKDKLKQDGFIVINIYELTTEDLTDKKYTIRDYHPNEAAWDLITPKVIEALKL